MEIGLDWSGCFLGMPMVLRLKMASLSWRLVEELRSAVLAYSAVASQRSWSSVLSVSTTNPNPPFTPLGPVPPWGWGFW